MHAAHLPSSWTEDMRGFQVGWVDVLCLHVCVCAHVCVCVCVLVCMCVCMLPRCVVQRGDHLYELCRPKLQRYQKTVLFQTRIFQAATCKV